MASRYRLDDLRRFASALFGASGLAPARASALATHLLWYDAAGLRAFGVASLAGWLEQIETRAMDPLTEGRVTGEMTGTAVFDGRNGVPPLVLGRAAELAMEKARESGIGLVRVLHVGPAGPVAAVAAELAIGPYVGVVVGHDSSWALALPAPEGLPAVFDSALGGPARPPVPDHWIPWAAALTPEGGWLVGAIAVAALEPLGTFHERVGDWLKGHTETPGALLPAAWETRRREAREHGVEIPEAVWDALRTWSERHQVAPPDPVTA